MRKGAQVSKTDVNAARQELRRYLETNAVSGLELSNKSGIGQSVLWRFLNGETQKITGRVQLVLDYAKISVKKRITPPDSFDPIDNQRLRQAVNEFCNGRPEAAALLARVIEAIGPVINEISTEQHKEAL